MKKTIPGGDDEYVRQPGFYAKWDLEQVIQPGVGFLFEEAGHLTDGTALYIVYRREGLEQGRKG